MEHYRKSCITCTYVIKSFPFVLLHLPPLRTMLEKEVERELVKGVKSLGGLCWKFTSPSTNGVPDRVVMLPKGKFGFVELKAPGKKLRPIQVKRNKQLKLLGVKVYVLDSKEMVKEVLHDLQTT